MVPVLDKNKKPLMPCSEKRARDLMEKGKAKPYWCKGVFCIILQVEPKTRYMQDIAVGIDPGSSYNGYSVKSQSHTLLNIQANAITDVKGKMESRRVLRRNRRSRNTPYRECRFNRNTNSTIPASIRARWEQHLNIVKWTSKMFNVTNVVIEDIKAKSWKGANKWNKNFGPLEIGKQWFSDQVDSLGYKLYKFQGYQTAEIRKDLDLKKNKDKGKKCFHTHCVDSWCIANEVIGGHTEVDNKRMMYLKPLRYHRRRLHAVVPQKGDFRRNYGSTLSEGLVRGTLVKHVKHGLGIVGGCSKRGISLHKLDTNKRFVECAKLKDLEIRTILRYGIAY
jgi:hypothetical protein